MNQENKQLILAGPYKFKDIRMKQSTPDSIYISAEQYVANFIKKPDQVDLFIANAPFMSLTQMTKLFKCYDYAILAVASALKIPINSAYAEIPLACIIARLKVLPPNAIVKYTSKGTIVILPKDEKYIRIVHHFSDGYRDSRSAVTSKLSDLPTHLQTKLWAETIES